MNTTKNTFNPANTKIEVPLILRTDSYKQAHYEQLAAGLEYSYVYLESRKGMSLMMFFGLQYILKQYIVSEKITAKMVNEAERFCLTHGVGFNREGWDIIVNEFDGRLPLEIRGLAEGSVAPSSTPMMVITNTDPRFAWLPMYFEALFQRIWYSCTVATRSMEQKAVISKFARTTVDDDQLEAYLMFALHDFGARGADVAEAAMVGGMSHLVSFYGSDTLEGVWTAEECYGTAEGMPAWSIFAIEHNVVLSWGESREKELFANLVEKYVAKGQKVSVLADTYDLDRALDYWAELKDQLIDAYARGGETGRIVVRPDSGDPVEIPVLVIQRLLDIFGYSMNGKGYKVLPDYIRVIQGDGTSKAVIRAILLRLEELGISAENIVFGQGGKLLCGHMRDDGSFAMKASAMTISGQVVGTSKRPKTDPTKNSKEGYFRVVICEDSGELRYERTEDMGDSGLLGIVCRNSELLREQDFDDIRARANRYFNWYEGDLARAA